jgi:hypothetical protein
VIGTRTRIVVGAVVLAVIALLVGLIIALSPGNKKAPPTHAAYARLFQQAVVRKTRISVLDQWPKPPYQTFRGEGQDQCFEWLDQRVALYDLCFEKNGILVRKDIH